MIKKFQKRVQQIWKAHPNYAIFGILAVLIVLFYGSTLTNGFIHDDIGQVVNNEYVHSLSYAPRVVTGCIWEFELGDCITYYRPIQSLSYLLTYQISSAPWVFHVVNLLLFFLVTSLVFILGKILSRNTLFAFLAALLFSLHPINNETVNWISAVPELTFTAFALLSFIFYIQSRESNPKRKKKQKKYTPKQIMADIRTASKNLPALLSGERKLVLAVLFYFLAMLSKEPAVLLPVLFVFFDVFIVKIPTKQFFVFSEVKRYALFFVAFLLYLAMRISVLDGLGRGGNYYGVFSLSERIHGFFTLFGSYILKLAAPFELVFFYPFEKSSDFSSLSFVVSVLVFALFVAGFIISIRKGKALFSLFLLWIFLFLSPVLFALNRLGENIFSERYLFASSIGFAYLLAAALMFFIRKKRLVLKRGAIVFIGIVVVVSWMIVVPRNALWKDDFALYAATIKLNPNAHAIRRNYAVELLEKGESEAALVQLQEIVERDSGWRDIGKVYNNLGDVHRRMGDHDMALVYYKKFEEVSGLTSFKPANNIGATLYEQGEYLESLVYTCRAMQINPATLEPQRNFSRLMSLFAGIGDDNIYLLYEDITKGGVFQKSVGQGVQSLPRVCSEERCIFAFIPSQTTRDAILPTLLMTRDEEGNVSRAGNPSYDSTNGIITIETSPLHATEKMTFIIPTCSGTYYETQVTSNQ